MSTDEELEEAEDTDELEPDLEDGEDEELALSLAGDEDEEAGDDASLEELLAERASARRAGDEDDEPDILSFASEPDAPPGDPIPTRVLPPKERQEFVCDRCHLVKARSQLADTTRVLCRDCV